MAQKIKLGDRPKNFSHSVTFKLLDGSEAVIPCVFKYRTREEFGEFVDKLMTDSKAKAKAEAESAAKARKAVDTEVAAEGEAAEQEVAGFSVKDFMAQKAAANADYIMQVLDGWGLDVDLSVTAVRDLANMYPAGASAIMDTYRAAIDEGRLGN